MPLEEGAEVNAQGGSHDNALQAASLNGHTVIVQFMLEKAAEVNARTKGAVYKEGAGTNGQGGYFSRALYAASFGGQMQSFQGLLEMGADVNAEESMELQAAILGGHDVIIRLLLHNAVEMKVEGNR
ncbi:hypothetical protein JB92DRAFT_2771137 [Gautieria morchelliformis]|nr:hypothetical protein JB92DRAFT_2771137 [Gautieria morchelliformis]